MHLKKLLPYAIFGILALPIGAMATQTNETPACKAAQYKRTQISNDWIKCEAPAKNTKISTRK